MAIDLLPPAPVMGGGQQMQQQSPHSGLAAALMQQPGIPMGGQMPQIPMSMLVELMKSRDGSSGGAGLWQGLGNWMNGRSWDGMASGQGLDALSQQAAAYTSGGKPGL